MKNPFISNENRERLKISKAMEKKYNKLLTKKKLIKIESISAEEISKYKYSTTDKVLKKINK
jgi:DNA-binding transcriptional regulator YiaG